MKTPDPYPADFVEWQPTTNFRSFVPILTIILAVLLRQVAVPVPGWNRISPDLSLCFVYVWALRTPYAMRLGTLFFLGLFADLINQTPPGVTSIVWAAIVAVVSNQQKLVLKQGFVVNWWSFAIVTFGAQIFFALLMWIFTERGVDAMQAFLIAVTTIIVFPAIDRLAGWLVARRRHGSSSRASR